MGATLSPEGSVGTPLPVTGHGEASYSRHGLVATDKGAYVIVYGMDRPRVTGAAAHGVYRTISFSVP